MAADAKTLLDYDPTYKPELPASQVAHTAATVMMALSVLRHIAVENIPHNILIFMFVVCSG